MNEHTLFLAALDIADPAERSAYLDRACAGDAALRQQVAALLTAHEGSGDFLKVPALKQLGVDTRAEQAASTDAIDLSFLQPSNRPGSLGRLGHYEIESVIGRGGCGIVLKALDEKLQRHVAIKVMDPELAATSPARKRFAREARAMAGFRHEHVIGIHAVEDQPLPYLVMEYVEGQTLQQRLDETGPLDVREVLYIGKQIALGLAAAHAHGLIHRDIKPSNILLEGERGAAADRLGVKLTDFGLARSADDASVTQSGVIAGTPLYMSPEQARGEAIDHRSDLFSLGSVLYVMCSGRPPFRAASTLAVLNRVAEDEPRPIREIIPEVPEWLAALIGKLHAKNRAERIPSAQAVAELLGGYLSELEQKGHIEPPKQAVKPRRRRRWIAAALIGLLLTGVGLSEAIGVTDVRHTIIRLFSPDGTLIVEVDDPGVSITVDGADMVITGAGASEIRLRPGAYKVLARKDGKVIRQELVSVTRNGRQVLRISKETPRAIATPAVEPKRRVARFVRGDWRIVRDVIEHPERNQSAMILFGSDDFGDGDFTCEALRAEGDNGLALVVRASDLDNYYYFEVGVFKNAWHSIYAKETGSNWRRVDQKRAPPVPTDRWVKLRLHLRGDLIEGYLDDQLVLSGRDDRRLKGFIGLRTWNEAGQYRNLKFTDSSGKVLWEGLPELPEPDGASAPKSADSRQASRPDYDHLAQGRHWTPVLTSFGETVARRNAVLNEGLIEIQDGHAYDSSVQAADLIVRARVQRLSGQTVMLTLRDVKGVYYSGFYQNDGVELFGIGMRGVRFVYGVKQHFAGTAGVKEGEFFELAFAAVGNTLTVFANGSRIGEISDFAINHAGGVAVHTTRGTGVFKNVEVMVLDY